MTDNLAALMSADDADSHKVFAAAVLAMSPTAIPDVTFLSRTVADLDDLLQLLRKGVVNSTPWGRLLQVQLAKANVQMQVLLMIISMGREQTERADAAKDVFETLRGADAMLSKGRTDATTLAAIRLAASLSQSIYKGMLENGV